MKNKRLFKTALSLTLAVIIAFSVFVSAYASNGKWIKSGSRWWYRHADGRYTKNGWEKIDGKMYHFDKKGWMQTGWIRVNDYWYYLKPSGAMKTGWLLYKNNWYYLETDDDNHLPWHNIGSMASGRTRVIKGREYGFDTDGRLVTNGWLKMTVSKTTYGTDYFWFYCDENGVIATGWKKIDGKWYYFIIVPENSINYGPTSLNENGISFEYGKPMLNGAMYSNGSYRINNKFYIFTKSGALVNKEGWYKINGAWFFSKSNGEPYERGWYTINGTTYYLNADGRMHTGKLTYEPKGQYNYVYYFLDENGQIVTGWVSPEQSGKSYWMYFNEDGTQQIGWVTRGNDTYHFEKNGGRASIGSQVIGSFIYYFDENGIMQTGECEQVHKNYTVDALYDDEGKLVQCKNNITGGIKGMRLIGYSETLDRTVDLVTEDKQLISEFVEYANSVTFSGDKILTENDYYDEYFNEYKGLVINIYFDGYSYTKKETVVQFVHSGEYFYDMNRASSTQLNPELMEYLINNMEENDHMKY